MEVLHPVSIDGLFRARTYTVVKPIQSGDDDYLMKLGGNQPAGDNPNLFGKWHGVFYNSSHTDTAGHARPWITQSHRHGWTCQALDYPVTQTRLDIPRPLITQSHRHGWTCQALDYPVTQTRLDMPGLGLPSHTDTAGHARPWITQSHRHGWTCQALDYPVTQTRLDIPRPWITQSHRHGWTYQGLGLPSHTDTAGHTKVLDYPVTAGHTKALDYPVKQTWLDIPRPWITQSHRHGWTYQGL